MYIIINYKKQLTLVKNNLQFHILCEITEPKPPKNDRQFHRSCEIHTSQLKSYSVFSHDNGRTLL